MATTRWKDTQAATLDEAIALLIDNVEDDELANAISRKDWIISRHFPENQEMTLFGKTVQYNYIKFSYNKVTLNGYAESNMVPQTGFIIVYAYGGSVSYIIDKNSDARLVLRKMLSYTGRNEIDNSTFGFGSDFFLWLIHRVYYSNNMIDLTSKSGDEMELESIKGFSGDTEDAQTKVTASGESVMNIISTLSFFLESRRLKQIKLDLKYKNHEKIGLILRSGTLEIDEQTYLGEFESEEPESKTAKLYLMGYIEIFPVLEQEYQTDIENELWNTEKYVQFMNDVADRLKKKIQAKTDAINAGFLQTDEV